ncbi:MAG: hypothetical protein WBM57_04295 [Woeseiaceae bacterium]|jgi:hypothetical protein
MALVRISGPVSNFREETKVTSTQTYNSGYSQVKTEKQINFRVDNRPVMMKMPDSMELTDGDEATVVGSDSGGGVKAILVRNDTINVIYGYKTWYLMMWAVIVTLVGLATIGVFVGLLLTPLGLYLLYKAFQHKKAYELMAA